MSLVRVGVLSTSAVLIDLAPIPRHELSQEVARTEPPVQFELDELEFLTCLRKARRGADLRPSGHHRGAQTI